MDGLLRQVDMTNLQFRKAVIEDLDALVDLLFDDELGKTREDNRRPIHPHYHAAFEAMDRDDNHIQLVALSDGRLVGTLQLTFIPGLARLGAWRGQIEGVRIHSAARGVGLGQKMVEHALRLCRQRGCNLVQLTTDKTRKQAHSFYEQLGFRASHEGYKLTFEP